MTAEDFKEFYGVDKVPFTVRGYAFFLEGKLAGLGGVRYDGQHLFAFSDIKDDVEVSKITIWRCTKLVMDIIDKMNVRVVAQADCNRETADRFLKRLGFVKYHDEGFYVREAQ